MEIKQALIYVAGFLCKHYVRILVDDTFVEYHKYGAYVDEINRGKLTIPSDGCVHFLYYMYISFVYLASEGKSKPCFKVMFDAGRVICEYYTLLDDTELDACCTAVCHILLNNASKSADTTKCKQSCAKLAKFS